MKKLLLLFVIILMGSACNKVSDEEMGKDKIDFDFKNISFEKQLYYI